MRRTDKSNDGENLDAAEDEFGLAVHCGSCEVEDDDNDEANSDPNGVVDRFR